MKRITVAIILVMIAVMLLTFKAIAVTPDLNGTILDEKGEPMPFVNVVLLSLPDSAYVQGAMTDEQGRFLMVRYNRKIDGKVAWRGEWRRTIRNGYTLTIDMRVVGRNVSSGDIGALNRIQNSISFVTMTEAPEALLTLAFSAPPPESTNSDSFTIKGTTRPGASVVVAYAALQSGQSKAIPATADGMGAFSIDVKLPGKDLFY